MESDSTEMVKEIKDKVILHWNCRDLREIPEVMRNHGCHVREIYLKWNQLTTLPSWIVELFNVTDLYVYGNLIKELPTELGNMHQLTVLDLSANKLELVPICICSLTNLKSLLLNNNCIEVLPVEMKQLKNLEVLSVAGNKIMVLPEWIGSLPKLKELNADNNFLRELPNRLTLASEVSLISVCSNRLRYLPLNGFVSTPWIKFHANDFLNYISYPVLLQLISHIHVLNITNLRCSEINSNTIDASTKNLKLSIQIATTGSSFIVIELPRQLLKVHKINENQIVSLWELSLRRVYTEKCKHILDISTSPIEVKVLYTPLDIKKQPNSLMHPLNCASYNLFMNGPTSICVNVHCQQPIFTEAWLLVGVSHLACSMLTVALCCCKSCATEFIINCSWTANFDWHCVN